MSVDQTRRTLNQLDKELADLEKKLANEVKKESDKIKRINDIQRSITKNTSMSTARSKSRQLQGHQDDLVRIAKSKAGINKKIVDKRKRRSETAVRLQKEESNEAKKVKKEQGRIYATYERRISELTDQITQKVAMPQSISSHLYEENLEEDYDVFISHASEDKESFADELCSELENSGIKVWYDDISMTWGDSLRSKIDSGLKKSKYGIVIISKDYIRKGWTQYELDGLFQIEMTNGKTILPIWHNISKKEVQDFSPTLAGRLALNTMMMTPNEVAQELLKILNICPEQEEIHNEKTENA